MALRAGRGGTGAGGQLAPKRRLVVLEGCLAQLDVPRRPLLAGVNAVGRRLDLRRRASWARGRVPAPPRAAGQIRGPRPGRCTAWSRGEVTLLLACLR